MSAQIRKIIGVALCSGVFCHLYCQQYMDYLQLGKTELAANHYTMAIEDLNIYLKAQPHMYEGYFFRAFAKYQLDDYAGAEHDYTRAVALYPFRVDIFCYRAIARDQLSDFAGALADYQKAIELDSSDAEIYVNRANTYLQLYRFRAALADCNHAEKLKISDENVYSLKASAESGLRQYKEAIRDYSLAIQKNPKNLVLYVQRGIAHYENAEKDSAMLDYNYALSVDSTIAYAFFQRAMMEVEDSDVTGGLRDLNKVISLSPGSAVAYFNRAILYGNAGNYTGALNDYNAVLQLDPASVLAYFNRADLEVQQGDNKAGLKDYNKAIELAPDFARAYYYRSLLKKDMNNLKGANADFAKASEIEKAKALLPDSARYMEEMRLTRMNALPGDFNTASGEDLKGKVQYKETDIDLQPNFRVVLWLDTSKHIHVYELPHGSPKTNTVLITNAAGVDKTETWKRITGLDSAITSNNRLAINYLNRAILYGSLKLYTQALADYDKAITLESANEIAYFCRANDRLNYLEQLNEQDSLPRKNAAITYEMVVKDYSHAIQVDTGFTYAWYNRARARMDMHDLKGATGDLTVALACDSTLPEANYNIGLLLFLLHNDMQACEYMSRAGELGILESYNVIKRYCYRKK